MRHPRKSNRKSPRNERAAVLRIIGGQLGGQLIRYNGDPATRPMKERVREAVFNLVGPAIRNKRALDLFAGTGAMGLEAISRGADSATLIERSFPNARVIEENAEHLKIADRVNVIAGDTFRWMRNDYREDSVPLVVFCCPPYAFYLDRWDDMEELIQSLMSSTASGSLLVVETDGRFDPELLPLADRWDVRRYHPAVISIFEVEGS